MSGISRQLAEAAPAAVVRVIEVPPVAGAALLGLDHVNAPAAAAARLRAAYDVPRPYPAGHRGSTRAAPRPELAGQPVREDRTEDGYAEHPADGRAEEGCRRRDGTQVA